MAGKRGKILSLIEPFQGRALDAHYLGYIDCFRRRLFFEAHEVLEELWLADRIGPNAGFYKGLIQLAGAFVHLQKSRLRPAAALFRLAEGNLGNYRPVHEQLDVEVVLAMIRRWLRRLETGQYEINPLESDSPPSLELKGGI